jgi:tRNA 2-selenouridine synthase
MPHSIPESAFNDIFLSDTPLLDVRAEIEFERGAFPNTTHLPLLDNKQREEVGKTYKKSGQQEAIAIGNKLVSGEVRQQRLQAWLKFIGNNPPALLYCFRGGLRSQTVQQWLAAEGVDIPLIEGGYKAMRNYLIKQIEKSSEQNSCVIIGGKTGSAKTHLLNSLESKIDLEGLANHRGSAFGRRAQPQPSQIDFENNLAIALLKLESTAGRNKVFLEDESRAIGSLSVPVILHQKMSQSPIAMIEESLEFRVNTILNDYIISNLRDFESLDPAAHFSGFSEFLSGCLSRIQKRLGGDAYKLISSQMQDALEVQRQNGDTDLHRLWISQLLTDYYDPMYEYQMNKKMARIVFRGSSEEFMNWASHIDIVAENTDSISA